LPFTSTAFRKKLSPALRPCTYPFPFQLVAESLHVESHCTQYTRLSSPSAMPGSSNAINRYAVRFALRSLEMTPEAPIQQSVDDESH